MALNKEPDLDERDDLAKAKKAGLRLLNYRPRSTEELRSRLSRKGHSAETIKAAIDFFTERGFLDDEKYAKLYTLSRLQSRPIGKRLMQRELKARGVPSRLADQAIGSIEDFDEKNVALEVATERYRRMTGLAENVSKVRLYGFLKRRGFAGEAVFYALSKLYKRVEETE